MANCKVTGGMQDPELMQVGTNECEWAQAAIITSGFPLGLENLEKWEGIFQSGKSQGILNRLENSGKSQGKSHKILENLGNLR